MAKILIIDDDSGIRHLLDAFLGYKGYEVLLAESGQKGLELFRHERPDVIVLDLKMPDMDGLTVLRHVRSLSLIQPGIMFAGAYPPKSEEHILALGITEMVTKDASVERLEEAVTRALIALDPGTVAWSAYSGTKHEDPDTEEFIRALDGLIDAQIDRQKPVRPWDD